MRTIKFRGKRCENGEWVYGSLLCYPNGSTSIVNEDSLKTRCVLYHVDKNTIGQYTGLKDKNHIEIYEGDIVKTDVSRANATKTKRYMNLLIEYSPPKFWNGFDSILMISSRMEVIGNIHDNPEMFEGGDK